MNTRRALFIGIALVAASVATGAKPHYALTGKVVAISDGDTLTILDDSKAQHKIRLAGIDAPEKNRHLATRRARPWATRFSSGRSAWR
jgi:endonuclease YncB( thermonuclease family)